MVSPEISGTGSGGSGKIQCLRVLAPLMDEVATRTARMMRPAPRVPVLMRPRHTLLSDGMSYHLVSHGLNAAGGERAVPGVGSLRPPWQQGWFVGGVLLGAVAAEDGAQDAVAAGGRG